MLNYLSLKTDNIGKLGAADVEVSVPKESSTATVPRRLPRRELSSTKTEVLSHPAKS